MELLIEIPDYSQEAGLRFEWEYAFTIHLEVQHGEVILSANQAGLVSLARHLLTLAQEHVPVGHHIHLDEFTGLEDASCAFIIQKISP